MDRSFKDVNVILQPLREIGPWANFKPCQNPGSSRLLRAGETCADGHRPLLGDITLDEDVAIPLRDGATIFADVYRPAHTREKVPAIICGGPFGKNGGPNRANFNKWPWRFGCPKTATTGLEKFEGLDPGYWCMQGYAIVHTDCRGTWKSTGDYVFTSKKEGEDNFDVVEFLAAQTWCNGRVSMAGNSYLAMTQWFTGAERPPHLACLAPWEGISDVYNDMIRIGGSPNPGFMGGMLTGDFASATSSKADNFTAMCYEYPLWNEYWESHRAKLSNIQCPIYIVASWTNQLHTTGTLRAWQEVSSQEKWLRIHNNHEWPDLYDLQSREDLRKFFDYYLKGVNNDWKFTPKVRLSVLNPGGHDIINRPEVAFPLDRQKELKLFLDASSKKLSEEMPTTQGTFSHDAEKGHSVFSVTFREKTEFIGYMKLRLWAEAQGSDDMDIFVQLQKFDTKTGLLLEALLTDVGRLQSDPEAARRELVERHATDPAFGASYFDSGPLGRIRTSHRELDTNLSTPLNPVYTHREEHMLSPGQVVPIDIGIWPYGWIFGPGDEMRLTITAVNPKPHLRPTDEPPILRNKGTHVFYTGGDKASYLLMPLIPSQESVANMVM